MTATFVLHRPAAPLAAHVESIWFAARGALLHGRERNLPTGRADIVIPLLQDSIVRFDPGADGDEGRVQHLRGAVVSGAHDRFSVRATDAASAVIGVHFRAGGAAAFFGPALAELHNRTVLLDALWGAAARELRDRLQAEADLPARFRLVEEALRARLSAACAPDPAVAFALAAFARDPAAARIDAVQRGTGCSPQQFVRRFDAAVGLTPKRYARVLRFNALLPRLVRVGPRDWAAMAADGGYFDQSHLIHEFRRLAGFTPSAYLPVGAGQLTHVAVAGRGKISNTAAGSAASLRAVNDQEPP